MRRATGRLLLLTSIVMRSGDADVNRIDRLRPKA
jgi:hypothetical protein